jgi:uncharacterized protein (DUF1778 family)
MRKANVKTESIKVRLSKAENKLVRVAAKQADVTVTDYIRGTMLMMATWQLKDPKARRPGQQVFFDLLFRMEQGIKEKS